MEFPSPDEDVRERSRKPHWKKPSFWKMFGTMLVIYLCLRILINLGLDWSGVPPAPGTGSESSSPITAPTDQAAPANPSK